MVARGDVDPCFLLRETPFGFSWERKKHHPKAKFKFGLKSRLTSNSQVILNRIALFGGLIWHVTFKIALILPLNRDRLSVTSSMVIALERSASMLQLSDCVSVWRNKRNVICGVRFQNITRDPSRTLNPIYGSRNPAKVVSLKENYPQRITLVVPRDLSHSCPSIYNIPHQSVWERYTARIK